VPDVHRLNITAKIWLSVAVLILGNVLSTGLSQIQGSAARSSLRTTSTARFPAAQSSQEAAAAFQCMVKGFGDCRLRATSAPKGRAFRLRFPFYLLGSSNIFHV
jgi:hypothetical protein